MSGWNNWSFKKKLFSVILLILALNVVVLFFMGSTLFASFYQASKVKEIKRSANRIQESYEQNSEAIFDEVSQIENSNAVVSLMSINEDGSLNVIYHSRSGKKDMRPWGDKPDMPQPKEEDTKHFNEQMLERIRQIPEDGVYVENQEFLPGEELTSSIILCSKLDDNLYLQIQTPRGYIRSTAELAVNYTAILSIAILLAGSVLIYYVANRLTRPITDIQQVADKISRLDFSQKCPEGRGDEIGKLAVSINNMSSELQASIEKLVQANEVLQNDLERQQQTDRMRRQFIANVSHDFKTPLTLMISYAEALAEGNLNEKQQECCGIIMSEGNKLSEMVGKLLNLSKLESGVDKPELSIFCLSEVIDTVIKGQRILSEKRALSVEKQMEEEFIVSADYTKIMQVVTNLFENAVKYTPEGGKIIVRARRSGDKCRVEIENTGTPVSEEDLENLFESFYRADKSRTAAGQSFGLGLAIVKVVMEAHEEAYGVENVENGVLFWFQLALADLGEEEYPELEAFERPQTADSEG